LDLTTTTGSRNKFPNPDFERRSLPLLLFAVLIQIAAFCITAVLALSISYLFKQILPLQLLLFIHCSISSCVAYILKFEWWWCLIQFFFPVALVVGLYFQLSPWLSLAIFFFLFLVFGATLRTRVPYFPSNANLHQFLLPALSNLTGDVKFLDVGSGLGGLLLDLSRQRQDWHFFGVEIALLPWFVSRLKVKFFNRKNVDIRLIDYRCLDFSSFDVVFVYLSPIVMNEVWLKAKSEMRPETVFVSYEFSVINAESDCVIETEKGSPNLYIWQM